MFVGQAWGDELVRVFVVTSKGKGKGCEYLGCVDSRRERIRPCRRA